MNKREIRPCKVAELTGCIESCIEKLEQLAALLEIIAEKSVGPEQVKQLARLGEEVARDESCLAAMVHENATKGGVKE